MVVRSHDHRRDIPVYNRFTARLDVDGSAHSDARLDKAVAGQAPPLHPCLKKNKGAATDGSDGLVGFNEMADKFDAAIDIPDLLRGPTSWQQQAVECGGIDLVERSIRVHRVPRPLNVGVPAPLLLMNNDMQAFLLGRRDRYIEGFFAHAKNPVIQIRGGTVTGDY